MSVVHSFDPSHYGECNHIIKVISASTTMVLAVALVCQLNSPRGSLTHVLEIFVCGNIDALMAYFWPIVLAGALMGCKVYSCIGFPLKFGPPASPVSHWCELQY